MASAFIPRPKATGFQPYAPRNCLNCGRSFQPRRHDQSYCPDSQMPSLHPTRTNLIVSRSCRTEAKNRALKRGAETYSALIHWVSCPSSERGEFMSHVAALAKVWRDEDRKLGVPLPPLPELIQTRRTAKRMLLRRSTHKEEA